MNMQFHGGPSGAFSLLAFLTVLFGIVTTIFWMVVGWRAMRAHERLAEVSEGLLSIRRNERLTPPRKPSGTTAAPPESAEDKFTPHKDAPPEFPWSKEV